MRIAKRLSIISLAFLMLITYYSPLTTTAQASYGEGSLLKIKANPAVYYIGANGKKYVFPEGKTYKTWFDDFSQVKEVSLGELDSYPDGGAMPAKGGVKLITHSNTAKIYALETGGILRHIPSEAKARELFGDDWYTRVIDVLPGFFASSYRLGEEVTDLLPNGYLVTDGSKYYYIENGKKRPMTEKSLKLNNLKESDALRIKNIAKYGDDDSIYEREESLVNFVPPITELEDQKITICHDSQNLSISKNSLKAYLAIGDALGECPLSTNEQTEVVEPKQWCSVLLGLLNGQFTTNHGLLDLNNDGMINLVDNSLAINLYNSGADSVCLNYISGNYTSSDYQNLDWCHSLVQGVADNIGDTSPFEPFDLNADGSINLSDIGMLASYVYEADQAQCYNQYVPLLPAMTSGGMLDNDSDNDGYNTIVSGGTDCNDNNFDVNPGMTEICGDTIDQDCSGADLACVTSDCTPITITNLTSNIGTSNPQTTASVTATTGSVMYLTVGLSFMPVSFPTDSISISGLGATWDKVATNTFGYRRRVWLFKGVGGSGTGPVTINYTGANASSFQEIGWVLDRATGLDLTTPNDNVVTTETTGVSPNSLAISTNGTPGTCDVTYSSLVLENQQTTNVESGWSSLGQTSSGSLGVRKVASAWDDASDTSHTWTWSSGSYASAFVTILNNGSSVQPPASDQTVPTTPSNLNATASDNQISLSWSASTDNVGVSRYLVERSTSASSGFTQIATPTNNSYNDSGLANSTTYYYRVRAQDISSNNSAYSSTVNAITGVGTLPPTSSGSPSISSVSGTVSNGQTLTISGTNFGTKLAVGGIAGPPVLWDNFEDGTAGNLVQPTAAKWDRVRSDNTSGPRYYAGAIDSSMGVRTGSGIVNGVTAGNTRTLMEDDEYRNLYLDYYIRAFKGEGLKQRSNKQVMIWSANAGISEDGPNTAFWQITQGGEEPPFTFSEYSCSNEPFSITYANGWGVDEFTTARHVQIEYRRPSVMGVNNGHLRMWYDGVLVSEDTSFGSYSCNPETNYLDNLFIGHYQDVDSAIEPQWKWISCPGDARCDQCPAGASGCSVDNDDWLPARQDEFFYDNIYIDKSIARVEIGNASTYAASSRREIQIPTTWNNSSIQITVNPGSFTSGQTVYLYVIDSNGNVNTSGYPIQ
ncbi:MAG: MopE-related protein, partial [Patescibacteria group bacterium]